TLDSALFIQTRTSASFSDLRQIAHQASDVLIEDTHASLPKVILLLCIYLRLSIPQHGTFNHTSTDGSHKLHKDAYRRLRRRWCPLRLSPPNRFLAFPMRIL